MVKFKDIPFTEFKELVEFLKFNDADNEAFNIRKRLERFIKQINGTQAIFLENIVSDILNGELENAENLYKTYQQTYPDQDFDPEGKLDLTPIQYCEISLQSCELLFDKAKNNLESNDFKDNSPHQIDL